MKNHTILVAAMRWVFNLKTLPGEYSGPRHVVTVKQLPPVEPGEDWFEWEERPGPEPAANATGRDDEIVVQVHCVDGKPKASIRRSPAGHRYRYRGLPFGCLSEEARLLMAFPIQLMPLAEDPPAEARKLAGHQSWPAFPAPRVGRHPGSPGF